MNAIPAKIAGVKRIVMVSPKLNGRQSSAVLYAAKKSGIKEIYSIGGAQAIAALAYGTKKIKKVNKICGPGNVFVSTAKKGVFGDVGIDMIAGPSEITVVADKFSKANWVAEKGLTSVMLPTLWYDKAPYHDIKYDPFWQACEDLGIIIHFHSGPAPHGEYFGANFPMEDRRDELPGAMGIYISEVMWWLYRPLTFMIWGGVFERFPRLKAMVVEGGTMFMFPTWLKLMDYHYNEGEISAKLGNYRGHLSMEPSRYFARNCGIGASCVRRADIENRHQIGLEQIMWGSDFPPSAGREGYANTLDGVRSFPPGLVRPD